MGHNGKDKYSVDYRLYTVGYEYRAYAENVAYGQDDVETVINQWVKKSPGHCKSIMGYKYTEIGLARKDKAWTLVLASPVDYNW